MKKPTLLLILASFFVNAGDVPTDIYVSPDRFDEIPESVWKYYISDGLSQAMQTRYKKAAYKLHNEMIGEYHCYQLGDNPLFNTAYIDINKIKFGATKFKPLNVTIKSRDLYLNTPIGLIGSFSSSDLTFSSIRALNNNTIVMRNYHGNTRDYKDVTATIDMERLVFTYKITNKNDKITTYNYICSRPIF